MGVGRLLFASSPRTAQKTVKSARPRPQHTEQRKRALLAKDSAAKRTKSQGVGVDDTDPDDEDTNQLCVTDDDQLVVLASLPGSPEHAFFGTDDQPQQSVL